MSKITECTLDEVFVKCLAKTTQDNTVVFHGVSSPTPMVAIPFARKTHAPNICYLGSVPGGVNPDQPFLATTTNDWATSQNAILTIPVGKVFDICAKGELDRMFFSGAQIDKYGNTNVTLIGNLEKIRIKLPGGAGGANMSCDAKKFTIWTTRHRAQVTSKGKIFSLMEKVDFITDVGHVTPSGNRKELGLIGGGPDWVVTNLGVFDFEEETKVMRLRYRYPDVTVEEILSNTGFQPVIPKEVGIVELPTPEEVELIRKIDPLNVRKREFPSEELKRVFPL